MDDIQEMFDRVNERVSTLKEFAHQDGIAVSVDSETDLYAFLDTAQVTRSPYLYIIETGHFKAVWMNSENEKISLTFVTKGYVDYLLRSKDHIAVGVGYETGFGSLVDMKVRIKSRGMYHLLKG